MMAVVVTFATFVVVVVVTSIPSIVTPVVAVVITAITAFVVATIIMVTFPILRNVDMVVPVVLNKVDALVAGVVLTAIPAPMPRVSRFYTQVNWCARYSPLHHPRLAVQQLRTRIVADVDATIIAGLADTDRNPDIGGMYLNAGTDGECCCENDKQTFHGDAPVA
jgi:hypothetical protein